MQEADAVRDIPREAHLVGRDHHGHAALRQLADHLEHLARPARGRARSSPRPAAAGRASSRARARSPRAAAGRRRAGRDTRPACRRARSGRAGRARSPPPRPAASPSTLRGASVTFSQHGHVREEVVGLEDDPDSAADAVRRRRRASVTSRPRDDDPAGVDRLEQVHAAQERRLARSRRADQAHDLVRGDGEVDPLQHLDVAERLVQVLDPQEPRALGHCWPRELPAPVAVARANR